MKEAAIGIIFFADKVLLIQRRDVPVWVLPGGGIEANEQPEESVVREVKEETNLSVSVVRKVGMWLPINRLSSKAHVFECFIELLPETLQPQEESRQVAFWPLNDLPEQLFFLHREWITAALAKEAHPPVTVMHSLTYWNCLKVVLKHPIFSIRYILSRLGLPINNG